MNCFSHLFPETSGFFGPKRNGSAWVGGVSTLWSLWLSEHHLLQKTAWLKPIRLFAVARIVMNLLLADSSAIQAEAFHVSGDLGTLGLGPKG